jgi:hypothetical protein
MDMQAQDSGLNPDPITAAVPTSARTQAITFQDPVYSDTAPTPVVAARPTTARPTRRPRKDGAGMFLLRAAIVIATIALLGGAAVLGLVKSGVIDLPGGSGAGSSHGAQHPAAATGPLTVPVGSGPQAASYNVDAGAFWLTIATGPGESWVSVGLVGQHPVFAGVLTPDTSRRFALWGSSQVEVGAGGTTLTLASGHRTSTLVPPAAPFTYQLATHV